MVTHLKWSSRGYYFSPLVLFILALISQPLHAAVSAQLSSQVIDELETVRLTIRASQTHQTEQLDLSALEKDFHIMGTNTSSQYRFRNGREQSWVDYQITLQPKRTGDITIPNIQVGQDQTPTITLTVQPLTNETRDLINQLVFFEQKLSQQEIYVQSQLILSRKLYYSAGVQLYSDLPGPPDIENGVVMSLGEPISSKTQRDGIDYGVLEQRYAIFPELSGTLAIPAINLTASVRLTTNGRLSRKGVRIGTEPTTVNVLSVPPEYPSDQPWLPASEVTLYQRVEPEAQLEVGDTITHEMLVYIEGNVGSIAPPLELNVDEDAFRIYPQSPVINDEAQANTVVGSRLQTSNLVPIKPGDLQLPDVALTWWDTQANKVRVATWPSQLLNVAGHPMEATNPAPPEETMVQADAHSPTSPLDNDGLMAINWVKLLPWALTTIGILTAILAAIVFTKSTAQKRGFNTNRKSNLKATANLLKIALNAVNTAPPQEMLQAVNEYLSEVFAQPSHVALTQFCQIDPSVHQTVSQLQQLVYATPEDTTPAAGSTPHQQLGVLRSELAQHLKNLDAKNKRSNRTKQTYSLPPLYPHLR